MVCLTRTNYDTLCTRTPGIMNLKVIWFKKSHSLSATAAPLTCTVDPPHGTLIRVLLHAWEYKIHFACQHNFPEQFTWNVWSRTLFFPEPSAIGGTCVIGHSLNLLIALVCPPPLHHRCSELGSAEQRGLSLGGGLNQWWQSHDLFLSRTHSHSAVLHTHGTARKQQHVSAGLQNVTFKSA